MKTVIYVLFACLLMSCQKEELKSTKVDSWKFAGLDSKFNPCPYTLTNEDGKVHLIASKMNGACYLYLPGTFVKGATYRIIIYDRYKITGAVKVKLCFLDGEPLTTHKEQVNMTVYEVFDQTITMTDNFDSIGLKFEVWDFSSGIDLTIDYISFIVQ